MKRRFISILLALAMVFSVVMPATVHAISEEEMESAIELILDTTAVATLNQGETAYFKFTPEYSCRHIFVSTSSEDPLAELLDSEGNTIASNDDMSDNNRNFKIETNLEAGQVYYLMARFYNSSVSGDIPVTVSLNHSLVATSNGDGTHDVACEICNEALYTEACGYTVVGSENGVTKYACSSCGHSYYILGGAFEPVKTWDFEDGEEGWTFVDLDGDGYNWTWNSTGGQEDFKVYHGEGYLYSQSYSNNDGALTPDNWAVSPAFSLKDVGENALLSVWAVGQDSSWAEEVFALYAGVSPNPDEMIKVGGDYTASSDYENFSVDLSAFVGKDTVYVAVRHYNVSDMFVLNVDYIQILKSLPSDVCDPGTHFLTEVPETTEATCTEGAHSTYYKCDVCGRTFRDAEGLNPVLVSETETSPALGHDWANCVSNNNGTHTYTCARCGETKTDECTFKEKTDSGVSKKVCDVCGYTVYSEVTGDKLVIGWGFEETLEGWTFIDADEDGYCWNWAEYEDAYEGSRLIYSASYSGGPLTPDNWAISPAFSLEGQKDAKLSLWASGYSYWPSETFALYASTSPDNLEGFVKISDDITTEGSFKNYTADLSAFDGEPEVYIAIRHYNTEDMYNLLLDLVEIYSKEADVCEVHDLTFVPAKDPTETEDGNIDYYYCEECGRYYLDEEATQPVLPEDVIIPALGVNAPQFTSHRIVLTGEVGVQFKVTLPEGFDASDSSVSFEVSDGRTSTMNIDDATPVDGENAYWFTCYINALELADTITATFNYGTDGAVTDTYSALTYISAIQAEYDDWSQLCNLVRDLRNYGHYLQLSGWTDGKEHAEIPLYEGSVLGEADLEYTRTALSGEDLEIVKALEGSGVEDVKFALTLNSQQVINFFVKLEEGVEIVNVEGGTQKGTQIIGGDTYYKFNTEEINVLNMDTDYTLTVYTTEGIATITANALTYIHTVVKDGSAFSLEKQYAMVAYYYYVSCAYNVLVNPAI